MIYLKNEIHMLVAIVYIAHARTQHFGSVLQDLHGGDGHGAWSRLGLLALLLARLLGHGWDGMGCRLCYVCMYVCMGDGCMYGCVHSYSALLYMAAVSSQLVPQTLLLLQLRTSCICCN
jgi:hypothetical protein